jgi:hypothetical protein
VESLSSAVGVAIQWLDDDGECEAAVGDGAAG